MYTQTFPNVSNTIELIYLRILTNSNTLELYQTNLSRPEQLKTSLLLCLTIKQTH